MPYKAPICGLYKIVNKATGCAYVGQSQNMRKRLGEHFRLLRCGKHNNTHLQRAYNKHGADNFYGVMEVECADLDELDRLEEAFLRGDAWFTEPATYNIAAFAKAPMRNRTHSDEVRTRISLGRKACAFDYRDPVYRETLSRAQMARLFSDPVYVAKIRFIVDNDHMSYAERARRLGSDTSSVRRLALRYGHMKGQL